jgi:cytochrome c1
MIEQILRDAAAADPDFSRASCATSTPTARTGAGSSANGERVPNNQMPYLTQVAAGRR